ncbi:hypothetical protein K438DRAFT_1970707 [Mycena galopus ATCC 62051]|nr:hypothetical protein K438DRAFT_1970707 [Mycena galopus ATCC 62051]
MAPRAAVTTEKAKAVAQLAAEEALEEQDKSVTKNRPGRPKGSKNKKKSEPEPVVQEVPTVVPEAPEEKEVIAINNLLIESVASHFVPVFPLTTSIQSWTTDLTLTWTLITAIEDSEETRESLFPGIGGIKRGGGLPKTHYYDQLAVTCFEEHPTYEESFAKAVTPKQKKAWRLKIKNRIKTHVPFFILVEKAKDNIQAMGETGAGIETEDDVQPGTALRTKWDLIKDDSPWFFHIRTLIASRPNLQPVGLGNNDSEIDNSILFPTTDTETSSAPDDTRDPTVEPVSDSEDDVPPVPTLKSALKRASAAEDDVKPVAKRTKPQPATSPAAPAAPAKKPTNAKDRFAATVLAEEETAQRSLRLKEEKNRSQKEVALAKIKVDADYRLMKGKARAADKKAKKEGQMSLTRLRMEQEHEIRMAQMNAQAGPSSFSGTRGSSHHRSNFSDPFGDTSMLPPRENDLTLTAYGDYSFPENMELA